jgi:hypothetical protein
MATASGFAELQHEQFEELLRLSLAYHREARRCRAARAYLGGCVMLGASLESSLMAMVHCFSDEVAQANAVPTVRGKPKPLLDWSLNELLRVAKRLGWLPARLALDEPWDRKRAKIGDYAEVVRRLRNLLHPARYLADHSRKRLTKRHLGLSFEVLQIAGEHLYQELAVSINGALENEGSA